MDWEADDYDGDLLTLLPRFRTAVEDGRGFTMTPLEASVFYKAMMKHADWAATAKFGYGCAGVLLLALIGCFVGHC